MVILYLALVLVFYILFDKNLTTASDNFLKQLNSIQRKSLFLNILSSSTLLSSTLFPFFG